MKKYIKKIIVTFGFLFLLLITAIGVLADTNVGIDIETDNDMYADINLEAGNNLYTNLWFTGENIHLNGFNLNPPSDSTGLARNVVFRDIYDGILGINNGKIFLETALNDKAKNIGRLLYSTFMPRYELEQRLKKIETRQGIIESTLEKIAPKEFCETKKDYMEINNWTSVPCGNEIHYRNGMVISDVIPKREMGGYATYYPNHMVTVNTSEEERINLTGCSEESIELKQGYKPLTRRLLQRWVK